MPGQVLTNIFIAILWMFLQNDWSVLTFSGGYLLGLVVLFVLRRFLPSQFYLFTVQAVIELVLIFIYEILTSSVVVISKIIAPQLSLKPGIFTLETSLERDVEITLLAMLITLTPGSVVVEISDDNKIFYVHTMEIPEQSELVLKSKDRFEEAIKKVTR